MNISKEDFFDLCTKIDWYYVYSDDYKVYNINAQKVSVLEQYAQHSSELRSIIDMWKDYPLSKYKPTLEDFV